MAACRPPSARKAARSRGAAPEPERERQAEPTPGSLSITNPQSSLKLMSIEPVMPSNCDLL